VTDAIDLKPENIRVGSVAEFRRKISAEDLQAFAEVSGDFNPLHVSAEYAATTRFGSPIAHGALQIGLASALAGMYLPGRRCILTAIQARFPAALRVPSEVTVRGEVTSWNANSHSGQLRIVVVDEAATITAEIGAGFTFHELKEAADSVPVQVRTADASTGRRVVLVTGSSGGIGPAIVDALLPSFDVIAVVNRNALPAALAADARVTGVSTDLNDPAWGTAVVGALRGRTLYGVVHAAWPGVPHSGLLSAPVESVQRQLEFATTHTISLAKLLFANAGEEGGRMVALGSIFGARKPVLSLATYSLAKSTLEQTVKMLAPELARKKITINNVCPSFVPAGMNRHSDDRARKIEAARVPLGRLCQPEDVAATVQFLFSPGASFLSGESIVLSGGQL
jgi:3-oxoacyl-[acyl-carrier protein] reductase